MNATRSIFTSSDYGCNSSNSGLLCEWFIVTIAANVRNPPFVAPPKKKLIPAHRPHNTIPTLSPTGGVLEASLAWRKPVPGGAA